MLNVIHINCMQRFEVLLKLACMYGNYEVYESIIKHLKRCYGGFMLVVMPL